MQKCIIEWRPTRFNLLNIFTIYLRDGIKISYPIFSRIIRFSQNQLSNCNSIEIINAKISLSIHTENTNIKMKRGIPTPRQV